MHKHRLVRSPARERMKNMQIPGRAISRKKFLKVGGAGVAGAAMLGTAGCAGGGEEEQGGDANSIGWQVIPPYSPQATDQSRVDYIESSISDWEESSEFSINPQVSSSNITAANARLLEQASQGRAPDIAMVDSYLFPRFYDFVRPLGEYMGDVSQEDYFPFARETMTNGGDVLGLQFTTDVRVMFYRTDLVEEPPSSWDELLEVGRGLRDREGLDPFLFPGGRDEATVTTSLLPYFWAQGGELVDDEGNPIFGEGENRESMLNSLNFIRQCVEAGITPQRVTEYGTEPDLNGDVSSGNTAMFLGANFQVGLLQEIMGVEEFNSQWAVAPIPSMEGGDNHATTAGGQMWGVFTENEDKQRAGVDFLKSAFVGNQGMAGWCNVGGYLPPRQPVFEVSDYEGNKYTDTFREHLEMYARNRPAAESYQDISTQLQIAVSNTISGERSPEDALEAAVNSVQS